MKTKIILIVGLVVVIGWAAASMLSGRRQSTHQAPSQTVKSERRSDSERVSNSVRPSPTSTPDTVVTERPVPDSPSPSSGGAQRTEVVKPQGQSSTGTKAPPTTAQPNQNSPLNDPATKTQIGRVALSFVGADADAEQVWLWAINDPTLPANARKDLIEDLNEDGFPDPKNPTADDMPLIENRIVLIEELAGNALDDVNYAAFQEAYKDLVNMWLRLAQQ